MLHGIERVSDAYFAARRDGECFACEFRDGDVCKTARCPGHAEYLAFLCEGRACVIAGFEQLDLFLVIAERSHDR